MNDKIEWLNRNSRKFLKEGYLTEGEEPEDRLKDIARGAEDILGISGFAEKFLGYLYRNFYSLSSPVWCNFNRKRGLPISCFGSYIPDKLEQICGHKVGEVSMMTKNSGGTSAYFGDVRARGASIGNDCGTSTGPVHFMEIYESLMNVVAQGSMRRGAFAAYMPVDHPDIEEFLEIMEEGNPLQKISIGVCVSDEWMKDMLENDNKANKKIWGKIIKKKFESGYPYVFFSDNVNKAAPQVYKDKNKTIHASNLCSEIMLSSSEDESFVCCLSSLNLGKWEEIQETDAIETMVYFLDAVMSEFITKTEGMPFMDSARNFAIRQRALGMGALGWHDYLIKNMIPFESLEAQLHNTQIWSTIRTRADKASKDLADMFGEPELLEGYGRRNTTTLAVAPTVSSSFIHGQVSQGIEPNMDNYFTNNNAKGKFSYRNPYLKELLKSKGQDSRETWDSILKRGGSVQHLDFLSDHEKDVFKTWGEISQKEIIIQAAQRQQFIDQGQSLNIMIDPETPAREVSKLMIYAWEQGIKSLYYQRSANPAQKLAREINECSTCEG